MALMGPKLNLLVVLLVLLLPLALHSQSVGFPTLDDPKELRAALEAIRKEDDLQREPGLTVENVLGDIGRKIVKNEVRLRNGYKTHEDPCSSNPELNGLVLNPPRPFPIEPYILWQDRLLNSSQSFCNPFKHLRCSNKSNKCECRQGLIWNEGHFEFPHWIIVPALRVREKICVIPTEHPCMIVPNNSTPIYFNIFRRGIINGGGLAIDPPNCGPGECSNSSYTQTHQVCAPRGWDSGLSALDKHFNNLTKGTPGAMCNLQEHNRLFAFSEGENAPGFLAKRKTILTELKKTNANKLFCNLDYFLTCNNSGKCECIFPAVPALPSDTETEYCALTEKYNQCEMSPELMSILGNKTLTFRAKNLLMNALAYVLKGCPPNFICVFEGDMDNPMELYCTCKVNFAGLDCHENLTKFLLYVRAPSFPSDVKYILEKRNIFSKLNKKAIDFEAVFKLQEFTPCNLTAELIAQSTIDRLQRLDKIGTVLTKADYDSLGRAIVDLTVDLQLPGLCNRFAPVPLECNSTTNTCMVRNVDILIEDCRKIYPFVCDSNDFFITSGGCGCAAIKNRELGLNRFNTAAPNRSLKGHHHFSIVIAIVYIILPS